MVACFLYYRIPKNGSFETLRKKLITKEGACTSNDQSPNKNHDRPFELTVNGEMRVTGRPCSHVKITQHITFIYNDVVLDCN